MYRVLVVEDEIPVRNRIIESIDWGSMGMAVAFAASDGQEALDFLMDNQVDLILTDIYMPFIDGIELVRRIRQTNHYCKVVFLTGYNEFEYAKEAVELDASKYLLKPITKEELTKVLLEMKDELDAAIAAKKNLTLLENEYEKRREFLKDKLLYDIIAGFMPIDRIHQACSNVGCSFDAKMYRIGVLEVVSREEISKAVWKDDYSLLHFAMYNISKEILSNDEHVQILLGENGKVIVLFMSSEDEAFDETTYMKMQEVLNGVRRVYEMSLTAGLSDVCHNIEHLRAAYDEAMVAIDYAIIEGNNRVIVKSDIEPKSAMNHDQLEDYSEKIVTAVKVNDVNKIRDYLHLFTEHIKFEKYELNEVKTLLLSMMTNVYDNYNKICIQDSMKLLLDFDLVEEIYAMESFESIETALYDSFSILAENLVKSRENDKNKLVLDAIHYIENNYDDPSIDLTFMSGMLHVSNSYFSRIFKKAKNQTFVEYMTGIRLDKAKELLRTSDKKVYEIAQQVGYDDAHYFSYNFRKKVGMTPLQYRKA